MKARPMAPRVFACVAIALGVTAVVSACLDTAEENILEDVPFDGGSLGPCADGATKMIKASDCPGACSGKAATAICVGTSFAECSCIPSTASMCDSGCCPNPPYYEPIYCKGKGSVVIPDPSEGLCDAANGYLACNNLCYASFSCEIPDGYSLAVFDAGKDAGRPKDGGKPSEAGDASDGAADAHPEGGDGSPLDAPPADAPKG